MDFVYLEDFSKTSVDDMELVQTVLKETGVLIDSKLFPYIEEAEKGDFLVQAELFEIFTEGLNDIPPNYIMAKRYAEKLQAANVESGDPERIAEGLKAIALMHYEFEELYLASDAFLECFTYTVKNLPVTEWDSEVIKVVADNLEDYQPSDEDEEYETE